MFNNDLIDSKDITTQIKPKKSSKNKIQKPENVNQQTWDDFQEIRKAKRSPLTETALNGIIREATKANKSLEWALQECTTRGWCGFKASWVNKNNGGGRQIDKPINTDIVKKDYGKSGKIKDVFAAIDAAKLN
jgi:hypothetical protein